jgi:hypothetical protein
VRRRPPARQARELAALRKKLMSAYTWDLPLDDIRDYFGEKIALYFAFVAFVIKWLMSLTLVGLAITLWSVYLGMADGSYVKVPALSGPAPDGAGWTALPRAFARGLGSVSRASASECRVVSSSCSIAMPLLARR